MRNTCLAIVLIYKLRLVQKSVTMNDLEGQNCVILPNLLVYGARCVKVLDKAITMDKKRLQRDRATPTV